MKASNMKTCPSFVKLISDGELNFMQNKCNEWMRYRNILPNHIKCQFFDLLQFTNLVFLLIIKKVFLYDIKTHKYWSIYS